MTNFYIDSKTDWTPALIEQAWVEIEKIANEEMGLTGLLYPNQIEIVSAEQMLDAYASIGLPVHYNHWSFGKEFLQSSRAYEKGRQNLAYEMVINSSPCINYLMEENLMYMQTMVMAHAGVGHNAVFRNNECFKQWTNAGSIVDYMIFARDYIRKCEDRYGLDEVELVIDAAHALAPHGVDKYHRKHRPALTEEARLKKIMEMEDEKQKEFDLILKRTSFKSDKEITEETIDALFDLDDAQEEENLLYFIMKKSPNLPQWKREIIRIVHKINQYFYPQGQTKNLNEGYASFCHYYIMTRLEEKGMVSSDAFIAFIDSHAGVIFQPAYRSRYYSGINPYALGFAIFQDIKRICENPTAEDKEWFPHMIGRSWQEVTKEAAFEHRDDSFVAQYLSPKVMRDMKMFSVKVSGEASGDQDDLDREISMSAFVSDIHDDVGYKNVRAALAKSLERINYVPQIEVVSADLEHDRTLNLRYVSYHDRELDIKTADSVLEYIDFLWGYPVVLDC